MSVRFLVTLVCFALAGSVASAQDPESGDTGGGWGEPPAETPAEPENTGWQTPAEPAEPATPAQQTPQNPPQNTGWQQQQPAQGQDSPWHTRSNEPEPPREAPADEEASDHDEVGFGLTFFGVNSIRVSPEGSPISEVSMPLATVGIRYWFGVAGLDVGVSLGTLTSREVNYCPTPSGDCGEEERTGGLNGGFGFGLHVGVPIAPITGKHWAFLVIPEIDFAYGTATIYNPAAADLDVSLSGLQFDAGVRVGGEFHFGGLGLPNLSLQVTIGLGFRYSSANAFVRGLEDGSGYADLGSSRISVRTIANDLTNGLLRINYYF